MQDDPDSSPRKIFVVGCPRSGTTVVQALLASLPGVVSLAETNYVLHLLGHFDNWLHEDAAAQRKWQSRLGLARRHTHQDMQRCLNLAFGEHNAAPKLRHHLTGRGYIQEFCDALDATTRRRDGHCWVEKTPDHLAYVDVLAELIPDAHFLHVVRNGSDVLASAVDGQLRYSEHNVFFGSIPYWTTRWNRAVQVHLQHAANRRHTVLAFECLFTAPDEVRDVLRHVSGVEGGFEADFSSGEHIANLSDEPWKHGSTDGVLRPPRKKVHELFGPRLQAWLEDNLCNYPDVVAELALRQPEYPWLATAAEGIPATADDISASS